MTEQIELPKCTGNDVGTQYEDYRVVILRVSGSDLLEQSNFDAARRIIGGVRPPGVIVADTAHWIYGRVTRLLVHKDDAEAIEKGREIVAMLRECPILDEDGYVLLKAKKRDEYRKSIEENPEAWDRTNLVQMYGDIEAYLDTLQY